MLLGSFLLPFDWQQTLSSFFHQRMNTWRTQVCLKGGIRGEGVIDERTNGYAEQGRTDERSDGGMSEGLEGVRESKGLM